MKIKKRMRFKGLGTVVMVEKWIFLKIAFLVYYLKNILPKFHNGRSIRFEVIAI